MRHIIFVHGIGDLSYKMAESFRKNIEKKIQNTDIQLHTFFWNDLVEDNEADLKNKIAKVSVSRSPRFSLKTREVFEEYIMARMRSIVISYFGDAVSYLSDVGNKVRDNLEHELIEIMKNDKHADVSIVAHSLGSVIAYDLLTSSSFQKRMKKNDFTVSNFFTIGSPLALFALRHDGSVAKLLPIEGEWINIYDNRDVIGSKLSPVYKQAKDFDIKVHRSNAFTTHVKYFDDPRVIEEILRPLK